MDLPNFGWVAPPLLDLRRLGLIYHQRCSILLRLVGPTGEMIVSANNSHAWKRVPMSEVPEVIRGQVPQVRAMPPMTWNGTLVGATETETHYLHLSAFPCEKCNGPLIAGSIGTRHDDISQETDIRKVGAACIACGFRPEIMVESSMKHSFRPIEWNWVIHDQAQPAGPSANALPAELSQDDARP
jgi:hypothetical protein